VSAADLLAELASAPRLPGAVCVGHSDIWSPTEPDLDDTDTTERIAFAVKVCRRCPALTVCRTWFDSLRPQDRPRGVVAGRVVS
jgi:WhiB family transcriptional regulator, redox-sensing transcriptional regulator